MGRVVIGMDPHKRSATIEVCDGQETVLSTGRFGTDRGGYRALLAAGRRWPDRVWAVEGCQGVGRHLAQRLVADGEPVVDVPAKLSARVRVFSTGGAARPTPPTRTQLPWRPCGPRVCARCRLMTPRWRCGCWSTAAMNSARLAPTP